MERGNRTRGSLNIQEHPGMECVCVQKDMICVCKADRPEGAFLISVLKFYDENRHFFFSFQKLSAHYAT